MYIKVIKSRNYVFWQLYLIAEALSQARPRFTHLKLNLPRPKPQVGTWMSMQLFIYSPTFRSFEEPSVVHSDELVAGDAPMAR